MLLGRHTIPAARDEEMRGALFAARPPRPLAYSSSPDAAARPPSTLSPCDRQLTELRLEVPKDKDVLVSVRTGVDGGGAAAALCLFAARLPAAVSPGFTTTHPTANQTCTLETPTTQLQQGTAEIFGAELSLGQRVNVRGQAVAVFTWDGCALSVDGDPDMA